MDIQFYGGDCITLSNKTARVTIDDTLVDLGAKPAMRDNDIALFTTVHGDPAAKPKIIIDHPGEYEVNGVSIYGIPARAHIDEPGRHTATMYVIIIDDIRLLVTGHIYPELSDKQLETIGMIDVMLVPVGGNGYTLDGAGALQVIKKIEPKIVIPTHYADEKLHFPVPQQALEQALQTLAMEPQQTVGKLHLKSADLGETTRLIVLERA